MPACLHAGNRIVTKARNCLILFAYWPYQPWMITPRSSMDMARFNVHHGQRRIRCIVILTRASITPPLQHAYPGATKWGVEVVEGHVE